MSWFASDLPMYPDLEQKHGITFKQANDFFRELIERHDRGHSIVSAWGAATDRAEKLKLALEAIVDWSPMPPDHWRDEDKAAFNADVQHARILLANVKGQPCPADDSSKQK